jgi:hypothetical protein
MMTSGFRRVDVISLTGSEEIDGDKMLIRLQDRKLDRSFFVSRAQLYRDS